MLQSEVKLETCVQAHPPSGRVEQAPKVASSGRACIQRIDLSFALNPLLFLNDQSTLNPPRSQREGGFFAASVAYAFCICLMFATTSFAQEEKPPEKITYNDHAKPVLMQRCSSCHNSDRKAGDLDITNYTQLMLGGGSGESIEPGSAEDSFLFRLVTHDDSPEMPPNGNKIPDPQIEVLRKWIDGGALENSGSVAKKKKPKKDYSTVAVGDQRPKIEPVPSRLPLVPQHVAARPATVQAIATNPWSPYVAVSSPKQVLIYNVSDLSLRGLIPFPEGQPESIRFSRNGSLLIIGGGKPGASGKVLIWDAVKGRRVTTVGDELDSVLASDINPAQTLVALGGPKKVVRVCSIDGDLIYEIEKHTGWITALQFSPDGKFLATGDRNGGVHVWEAETGNEVMTLSGHRKSISSIDWRIDGELLLTSSDDGDLRIWDGGSGKQIKNWKVCNQGVTDACFTRDGKIVTGARDRSVRFWQKNGKMIHQYDAMSDQVSSVAYCSESNRVIAGDWLGKIHVWDKPNKVPVGVLDGNPPTIETRVTQIQSAIDKAIRILDPLQRQSTQLDGRIASLKAQNEADVEMRKATEAALGTLKGKLAQADQLLKSTGKQQQSWRGELDKKKKAAPQLESSLANARSALEALGDDKPMQETVDKLAGRKKQLSERISFLKTQLRQANKKKETIKAEMAKHKTERDEAKTQIGMLNKTISERAVALGKANDQRAKLQQQLVKTLADVHQPQRALERWRGEFEFAKRLAAFEAKLTAAEKTQQQKLDEISQAQQKMESAQLEVQKAQQRSDEFSKSVDAIEQQIQALKDQ